MGDKTIKITIDKYWHDCGNIHKNTELILKPGLSVLVGCNGCGKTSTLHQIEHNLKKNKTVRLFTYDNYSSGGLSANSGFMFDGNMEALANNWSSSEGEEIINNFMHFAMKVKRYLFGQYQLDNTERIASCFMDADEIQKRYKDKKKNCVVLIDALDSGLSVDSVIDLRDVIENLMMADAEQNDITLYLVLVANEYELARHAQCIDLWTLEYFTFKDYEDYRKYILSTRKRKNRRLEQYSKRVQKELEKEMKQKEERPNAQKKKNKAKMYGLEVEEDSDDEVEDEEATEVSEGMSKLVKDESLEHVIKKKQEVTHEQIANIMKGLDASSIEFSMMKNIDPKDYE